MDCRSLGFATDLAILELGGSAIERRESFWRIETPHAPTYYWGNFLLLDPVDQALSASEWKRRFSAEFPQARHFALGIDAPHGRKACLNDFSEEGTEISEMTVLTSLPSTLRLVQAEAEAGAETEIETVVVRQLESDDDWDQALKLGVFNRGQEFAEASYRNFFHNYLAMQRCIVGRGRGMWWGTFVDGALVAQAGIIDCDNGLARYQMVSTHPMFRRRGFAASTVSSAGYGAAEHFGTEKLVIVADPSYYAIALYEGLGFHATETQLSVEQMS